MAIIRSTAFSYPAEIQIWEIRDVKVVLRKKFDDTGVESAADELLRPCPR